MCEVKIFVLVVVLDTRTDALHILCIDCLHRHRMVHAVD